MDHELRTFTIEEANQLIPLLGNLLRDLKKRHNQAVQVEAQIDALELIADQKSKKSVNELNRLTEIHHKMVTEFYAIAEKIHSYGCVLKDVETGLIDFYSVLDGKVVYLCWKLGERSVAHWHEIGKGYGYRQPLSVSPSDVEENEEES